MVVGKGRNRDKWSRLIAQAQQTLSHPNKWSGWAQWNCTYCRTMGRFCTHSLFCLMAELYICFALFFFYKANNTSLKYIHVEDLHEENMHYNNHSIDGLLCLSVHCCDGLRLEWIEQEQHLRLKKKSQTNNADYNSLHVPIGKAAKDFKC